MANGCKWKGRYLVAALEDFDALTLLRGDVRAHQNVFVFKVSRLWPVSIRGGWEFPLRERSNEVNRSLSGRAEAQLRVIAEDAWGELPRPVINHRISYHRCQSQKARLVRRLRGRLEATKSHPRHCHATQHRQPAAEVRALPRLHRQLWAHILAPATLLFHTSDLPRRETSSAPLPVGRISRIAARWPPMAQPLSYNAPPRTLLMNGTP